MLRWGDFEHGYFAQAWSSTGIVKSMKDFYWDIRPKPEFGTIELRVCDTPLTVERAAALAGYLQALCRHAARGARPRPAEDDYLVYNYNRFQACRFGLDGAIVHPKTMRPLTLREDILATLNHLRAHAEALGASGALDHLDAAVREGGDAAFLRRQYALSGSSEGMVDAAIRRFRAAPHASDG